MKKVIPGKIKTQLRLDGYYNVLNKYGTQHDSTEYYQWASGSAVSDTELASVTILQIKSFRTERVMWLESSKLMGSRPSI